MSIFGDILGIGGSFLGGLFGDDNEGYEPSRNTTQTSSTSGFATLPQEVKDAYLQQFLPGILAQFNRSTPYRMAQGGRFNSRGLADLQRYFPGQGVEPVGQIEPFNMFQQNALNAFGEGIDNIEATLSRYMNPYQQGVTDRTLKQIQEQSDIERRNIMGRASRIGLNPQSSSLALQLSELTKNSEDRKRDFLAQANERNYNQALGLRSQTLGDMLKGGSIIQGQNQNVLNNANNMSLRRLAELGSFLNMIPMSSISNSSSTQVGATPGGPNIFNKVGGLGMSLGGLGNDYGWWGQPNLNFDQKNDLSGGRPWLFD